MKADSITDDKNTIQKEEKEEEQKRALNEEDVKKLKSYMGPYAAPIHNIESVNKQLEQEVIKSIGSEETDTGLAPASQWNLRQDAEIVHKTPLIVAQCTQSIETKYNKTGYVVNIENYLKYVSGLSKNLADVDIEVGSRVAISNGDMSIAVCRKKTNGNEMSLQKAIDPTISMMEVEDKPDVTYDDIGGATESLKLLREVVEVPILHPERFVNLGIDPPKGVLLYGPPGTGKTLTARAVANRTEACFIRAIGSELTNKYTGEGAAVVREIFTLARTKRACIIFFDEIDAIGGSRFADDDDENNDSETQRTMLEIINQLDGFDSRGNIKVLMATNRPDTLDPALKRPGRLDRKIEFGLPDLAGRTHIFKIHTRSMSLERGIRFELLARLCPNATGAEIRSVCTEAGLFAIRDRRKAISEKDFLNAVDKVIKGYQKFSSTSKYMVYN